MSNIMRNCVIEMEIANINLSLLSTLPFSFDDGEIMKKRYEGGEDSRN